jgi:hypothetical protein
MRSDAAHRAVTDRRIFQAIGDFAGLGCAVDMRRDDAERARARCGHLQKMLAVSKVQEVRGNPRRHSTEHWYCLLRKKLRHIRA